MPSRVPTVRYTEARLSSMRTSLSSAGVYWHTPMGYPNYAHHRACALSSRSPFHYVTAKIVSVVQLAAHAKSSTLYGRSYGRTVVRSYVPICFDRLLLLYHSYNYGGYAARGSCAASSAINEFTKTNENSRIFGNVIVLTTDLSFFLYLSHCFSLSLSKKKTTIVG